MANHRPTIGGKSPASERPLISDFILQERLGSGSYAVVFKAFWKTFKETVALKRIQKSRLNPASIENLLLEIEILKSIKHDFIVEMKDFTWDADYIYLILEYAPDGDLSTFIRSRRRLPEVPSRRLLQQIGKALQFLRSRNVAHMDLKPKNILLSSSREPFIKIADFGFAQYLKPTDGATDLRGSPLYMAPEMFTSRSYDARVDLWSVGVIFYECLFGKAPYSSKSIEELVLKITDNSPVMIPTDVKISENCCDLLKRLLQKDPRQRITFESFFAHPFLDFEHFPSRDNNEKAAELAKIAAQFDKFEDYSSAITKYLECLDYLVVALTYEKNELKKRALKDKVQHMMSRTEELKQIVRSKLKANAKESPSSKFLHDIEYIDETSTDYLKRLFEDQPAIVAALESGCTAEYMELQGYDKVAVEYYEVAIERLIRFTKGMPFGEKRTKLQKQIADWLANAEALHDNLRMFEREKKEATPSPPVLEASVYKPMMKDPEPSASSMRLNTPYRSHR